MLNNLLTRYLPVFAADGVSSGATGGDAATAAPAAPAVADTSASSASAAPGASSVDATSSSTSTSQPTTPAADGAAKPGDAPAGDTAAKESASPSLLSEAKAKPPGDKADAAADQGGASDAAKAADKTDAAAQPTPDPKKDAAKAAPDGKDAAPAEKAPAEAQARSYEAFTLPEGVTLAEKDTKEFTGILDDAKLSPQQRAQQLVDIYVREAQRLVTEQRTQQRKDWNNYVEGLKTDFRSDVEFANRHETVLGQAKYVVEQLGGKPEQVADLLKMLDHTGMGNYVGFVRIMNSVYERFLKEPSSVPANAPSNRKGARGNFQDVMYD